MWSLPVQSWCAVWLCSAVCSFLVLQCLFVSDCEVVEFHFLAVSCSVWLLCSVWLFTSVWLFCSVWLWKAKPQIGSSQDRPASLLSLWIKTYYCDAGDDDNNCDGGNEYDHDDNQNKYCGLIHINKAYNCPSQINVNSTISEFHGKIEANTKVSFKYKYEYKYKYELQRQIQI